MSDTVNLLREIAAALAVLVSPFVLALVWRAGTTVRGIQGDVQAVSTALTEFSGRVTRAIEDHETRMRVQEGKMAVVWDKHERRLEPRPPSKAD